MVFARQSLLIILSIGLAMFFKSFFLKSTVPFLGILVILYLIFSHRKKIENFNLFILISLVLILIFSTGEISSPLFFLLYFLSFAVAFAFDPKVVFVFTAGLIVALFPGALKTDLTHNLILLFSLFLLSPIAFFLGIDYHEKQKARKKIEDMNSKAQAIENDIEDVLYDDEQSLNANTADKLNEALLEAEEVEETK